MSQEDQNQGSAENQTTEQVEKEEVHLSPATRKQAQDAINAGHQDKVDPSIKDQLLREQNQRNHVPEPEQPAPVEAPVEQDELETIEEAIAEIPEEPLHQAIFSNSFVISEPRVKVQLIVPLISGSDEVEDDEWVEELEDGTPLSFKHTLANGGGKKGTLGVMYNTVLNAIETAAEFNGSNIKVANNDMTRQAMAEVLAENLTERCQILVPEEMAETIVERFDHTASFYPGVLATPCMEDDTVAIQVFTPVPLIATSDDKLVRYVELIEKYFGEYDTDLEVILLADPIESVFDDIQRTNVRVAVEELGFSINTMDNLIAAVEADAGFDLDQDEIDDEEGWDESEEMSDYETSLEESDDESEDADEDEDEVVEDDEDDGNDESESDDEFGFTLPQSMDRMSHLIRDENNLSGLGLIVLGKKL